MPAPRRAFHVLLRTVTDTLSCSRTSLTTARTRPTSSPIPQSLSSTHLHPFRISMRPLTADVLNPAIRDVEYAVRGELAIKAENYRVQLKTPNHGLPFDKIISSNIGNPQQKGLDQPPLTFPRQVRPSPSFEDAPSDSELRAHVNRMLIYTVNLPFGRSLRSRSTLSYWSLRAISSRRMS